MRGLSPLAGTHHDCGGSPPASPWRRRSTAAHTASRRRSIRGLCSFRSMHSLVLSLWIGAERQGEVAVEGVNLAELLAARSQERVQK